MKNYLFSNFQKPNLFRYFRLGEKWYECFVVEFILGSNHYEHLYWGNQVYVEEDRFVISTMLITAHLPTPRDKWKKENLEMMQKGIDITPILQQVENEIKQRTNKICNTLPKIKQFRLIIDGDTLTRPKMEASCKFLDEISTIEGVVVNPDTLTIDFNESLEKNIVTIAKNYGIVDLTEW